MITTPNLTSSYLHEYFIVWNEWGPQDFGKPHLEEVHSVSDSVCLLPFFLLTHRSLVSSRALGAVLPTESPS